MGNVRLSDVLAVVERTTHPPGIDGSGLGPARI